VIGVVPLPRRQPRERTTVPPPADLDPAAAALIRRKAARLVGRAGFHRQDFEDLVHDLAVALLDHRHHYDPARGAWAPFAATVVSQAGAKLLRDGRAGKRDYRRRQRWDEDVVADQVVQRGCPAQDLAELLLDVAELLSTLPPELHTVAVCLQQGLTIAAAARMLGVRRTTLYGRLRQLRERFAALAP